MISWTCIADGTALNPTPDALVCPQCDARYATADGLPTFGSSQWADQTSALLNEILTRSKQTALDDAATEICKDRGLLRNRFTTDWDFFLPVTKDSRVLHVGPGFGDRTLAIGRTASSVIALAPSPAVGRAVQAHAKSKQLQTVHVAATESLKRLPLADASVDVVALDVPGAKAFGIRNGDLAAVMAEFRRVLAPGGTLLLGATNRLFRLPGLDGLRPGPKETTLDDALAAEGQPSAGALAIRPALSAISRIGFQVSNLLSPLPRREQIDIVLPVREKAVMRYFFDRLLRKNSAIVRAGLVGARVASSLGMVWWCVPDYFVVAQSRDSK